MMRIYIYGFSTRVTITIRNFSVIIILILKKFNVYFSAVLNDARGRSSFEMKSL